VFRIGAKVSTEYTALIFRVQCAPPKKVHTRTNGATFRKPRSLTRKQLTQKLGIERRVLAKKIYQLLRGK